MPEPSRGFGDLNDQEKQNVRGDAPPPYFELKGDLTSADIRRLRDAGPVEASAAEFIYPHPDARVLHSPGVCTICDQHAPLPQRLRKKHRVPFTDELAPEDPLLPMADRTRRQAETSGGNHPPERPRRAGVTYQAPLYPDSPPQTSNIAQYKGILGRIRARWNRFRAWLRD